MTTTVTVKTHGHNAYVTVSGFKDDDFVLLPGVEKDFTVTDTQSVIVEEHPITVIHPPKASVV